MRARRAGDEACLILQLDLEGSLGSCHRLRASVTESEGSEVPSQGSDQGNHSTTSKNEQKGQDGRRGRRSGG